MKKQLQRLTKSCSTMLVRCLVLLVRLYQWFVSPLLGPRCRFYPSCSEYCQQALVEHGPIKGLFLAGKRICRCHPGHPGGVDPVPRKSC